MKAKLYPSSPELDTTDFLLPSEDFKKVTFSVAFSIVLFFLFYLVLIVIGGAVMFFAGWAGVSLIAFRPGFLTLAAGAGLIILGLMVFVFLIKFIFSRSIDENPFRQEVRKQDHPELFAFIEELAKDTKTRFPKKIYVSPDVNAMVFYNSSFWSLFFPVRKNLEIGLGLVNSLTISEFKAVLAHEFGHFSQSSMKLGSYIYTVNRVIYNLVYEYDNWDNTLSGWAETGGVFGFFAGVTFWIVEIFRAALRVAYNLINVNYMRLSREMEYHADLVAVSVSGNKAFREALRKIEFSSMAYDQTTRFLNRLVEEEQKASENIYTNHKTTIQQLCEHLKLECASGAFRITDHDLSQGVINSRINIEDQWASHPTLQEREDNIAKVDISADQIDGSAWELFTDIDSLQKRFTGNLYQNGFPKQDLQKIDNLAYDHFIRNEVNKHMISDLYNGFYNDRFLSQIDLDNRDSQSFNKTFEDIYSKGNIERIKRLECNKADLEILQQIHLKSIQVKYFEFDGKKYKNKQASSLIDSLKLEIDEEESFVHDLDQQTFLLFIQEADTEGLRKELLAFYKQYFTLSELLKGLDFVNMKFQNLINQLYAQPRWSEEALKSMCSELASAEGDFKVFMKSQDWESLLIDIANTEQREVVREYLKSSTRYLLNTQFEEESLVNLSQLMAEVTEAANQQYSVTIKGLTDFQLTLHQKAV